MKKLARAMPILAIAGLAVSGYLLWAYLSGTDLGCHAGCGEVRQSTYARLLGLPTPAWGIGFYVALLLLSLFWNQHQATERGEVLGWSMLTLTGLGLFASASLTYVEVFIVRALCLWCLVSAAISLLAFLLTLPHFFGRPMIEVDRALLAHLAVFFVAMLAILVGIAQGTPPPQPVVRGEEAAPQQTKRADPKVLYNSVRHPKGPQDALITLVEFVDFQCGTCATASKDLQQILERYPGKVRLIVRHHPLAIHSYSSLAAEASETAGAQGKFWEMYEYLMNNQAQMWTIAGKKGERGKQGLRRAAQELGLNVNQFMKDLESHKFQPVVEKDRLDGAALGVTSTPTIFLNEEQIGTPLSIVNLVEQRLKKLESAKAKGQGPRAPMTTPSETSTSGPPPVTKAGPPSEGQDHHHEHVH